MSRKILLTISSIVTFLMIMYMGYDACTYQTTDYTLRGFLDVYLDNPQKYIFNGMIYGVPAIYAQMIRINTPELLVRMKDSAFYRIIERSVEVAFFCSLYVIICHLLVAYCIGLDMIFDIYIIQIFSRTFIFYLQCSFFLYFFYSLDAKPFLSTMIVVSMNMVFLFLMLGIDFAMANRAQPYFVPVFIFYECFGCIISFVGVYFSMKRGGNCLRGNSL